MNTPLRFFGLAALLLASPALAAAPNSAPNLFPDTITYRGFAVSDNETPRNGKAAIRITVLDSKAKQTLASERYDVVIEDGRFTVEVGSKTRLPGKTPGLRTVFARNPQVLLEVSIDDVRQYPHVLVQPRGHSPASIAALSAALGARQGKQTKAYYAAGSGTGVQAVQLRSKPGLDEESTESFRRNPLEITMTDLGVSRALREFPSLESTDIRDVIDNADEANPPRHGDLEDENGNRFGTTTQKIDDPLVALQRAQVRGSTAPALSVEFEGIGNVSGVLPPDTEGAVGPDHYLQVVNSAFSIYNKAGTLLQGPLNTNTLWAGFGGLCQSDNNGDAIFLYDQHADKWVLTQFTSGNVVCFAVSTTTDPQGTYRLFQVNTQRFPDYYKVGMWPAADNNAYFLTTNSGFQGGYDVYAIDRQSMISAADPARPAQVFQNFPNLFMPADVDGRNYPESSDPGLLYTFLDGGEPYFGSPPADSLELYEFDVDWDLPASSTFSLSTSFSAPGELTPFNWTVCGFFQSNCLPQPSTAQGIDSASWWPMQRFVYRKFADHEALVGAWTVDVLAVGDQAAPRWFELRRDSSRGGWSIHQQGTYAPDTEHRFMPSIAMDGSGNIAMGYSLTSGSTFPSIHYAVHEKDAPLGTMSAEAVLEAGEGSQTHSAARWGDYSSMELDPADDCTFWFTTEYLQATGSAPWTTRVGAFKVPGCVAIETDPSAFEVCSTVGNVASTITLMGYPTGGTDLSVTGCPAGASCVLDDTSLNTGSDVDTSLSITSLGSVSTGEYSIEVTATDSTDTSTTASTFIPLTLFDAIPSVPLLTSPSNGSDPEPFEATSFSWTGTGAASYTIEIATDAGFSMIVDSATVAGEAYLTNLESLTTYYWRVKANNTCGESAPSATFSFTTDLAPGECPIGFSTEIHSADDLEGSNAAWTSSGTQNTWQESSARTHSGSTAFWAEDVETESDQYLVSPSMSVPTSGTQPALSFWNYQEIESSGTAGCWDGAVLDVSNNGGSTWTRLDAELLSDPYDGPVEINPASPISGENAWCGEPQDWLESIVDLSAYAGDTVQFRFRLATDAFEGREGWYIDDLAIQTCVGPEIFSDGFESGDTTQWSNGTP